jgi:prophage tail gpP-like protein
LSTTYKATGGESWSTVAMMTTGNDLDADKIRRANPSLSVPISPGAVVTIPDTASTASSRPGNPSIVVNGIDIEVFDDFELVRAIDAIGKGTFTVPNEKENRRILKPLQFPITTVSVNNELIFTGRCNSPLPSNNSNMKVLDVNMFSLPGIMEVCGPAIKAFPLEWKKQTLEQIADELCSKQGISTEFKSMSSEVFKRVDIQPGDSVLGFLADLAKQRGFVISDDKYGALVFQMGERTGAPVMSIKKDEMPCTSLTVQIDDNQYYSSVTGYVTGRSHKDFRGKGYTVNNPYMTDIIRPYLTRFENIDEGELQTATETTAGRMFSEVFSVTVELCTWFDDFGNVFRPNSTIKIQSEEDYLEDPFEFLISQVDMRKTSNEMTCSLHCVLPGVFSGEIPEAMPWRM